MATSRPAHAQPVDAQVQAAISAIEIAEKQITGLTGNLNPPIARIARDIEGAASILESSPNKKHPSWLAANERIDTLMIRLSRWSRSGSVATH